MINDKCDKYMTYIYMIYIYIYCIYIYDIYILYMVNMKNICAYIVITSKIRTPPYVFSSDPGESWLIRLLGMLDRHPICADLHSLFQAVTAYQILEHPEKKSQCDGL